MVDVIILVRFDPRTAFTANRKKYRQNLVRLREHLPEIVSLTAGENSGDPQSPYNELAVGRFRSSHDATAFLNHPGLAKVFAIPGTTEIQILKYNF